jgi:hypothetical protein
MKKEFAKWVLLLEVVAIVALHANKNYQEKTLASQKESKDRQAFKIRSTPNVLVLSKMAP